MEKTRTITVDVDGEAFYRGKELGYLQKDIRREFNVSLYMKGKYRVTIRERKNGLYQFKKDIDSYFYKLRKYNSKDYIGLICRIELRKLFFKVDGRKRYSIVVKEI